MKKLILLVAVATATSLAGCITAQERVAQVQAQNARMDDQKCLAYGARPGTDAYVTCRVQLESARMTAAAIEDAAPDQPVHPAPISATPAPIQPMVIPGPRCTSRGC